MRDVILAALVLFVLYVAVSSLEPLPEDIGQPVQQQIPTPRLVVDDKQEIVEVEQFELEPEPLEPLPIPDEVEVELPVDEIDLDLPTNDEVVEITEEEPVVEETTLPPAPSDEPIVIDILAKSDVFSPEEIRLQRGQSYELHFTSIDADHALQLLPLGVTYVDIPLGRTAVVPYTARLPGKYPIICLKNCGTGSQQIKAKIIVE